MKSLLPSLAPTSGTRNACPSFLPQSWRNWGGSCLKLAKIEEIHQLLHLSLLDSVSVLLEPEFQSHCFRHLPIQLLFWWRDRYLDLTTLPSSLSFPLLSSCISYDREVWYQNDFYYVIDYLFSLFLCLVICRFFFFLIFIILKNGRMCLGVSFF